jgi:hypothetical protein
VNCKGLIAVLDRQGHKVSRMVKPFSGFPLLQIAGIAGANPGEQPLGHADKLGVQVSFTFLEEGFVGTQTTRTVVISPSKIVMIVAT